MGSLWATYKHKQPLMLLMLVAFIPRLVAAIFSQGYGMHDDHFLIIEAAQSWVEDYDYNTWLPSSGAKAPTGHSWFYVGLHYFLFSFFEVIGLTDPKGSMYVVRLLHGLLSLLVLPPVYFLVKKAANKELAFQTGLIVGLLFFMPIMGVRNLVEMVSTVPMLWALWLLYKHEENLKYKQLILPGILMGVAMSIRFHMILFVGGIGLVLLFRKQIVQGIVFSLSLFSALFVTQIADVFIWGYPFAEIGEYIAYNLANKETYFSMPWYHYLGTIAGFLVPPISVVWFFGYLSSFKKLGIWFWPSFIFFAFHCYFPNKQERFILPLFPIIIALGNIMWHQFLAQKNNPIYTKMNSGFMKFFWGLNLLTLIFVTPAYSKKSRVESMYWLGQQSDYNRTYVEYMVNYDHIQMPLYYANSWGGPIYIEKAKGYNDKVLWWAMPEQKDLRPNYALFFEEVDLENRVKTMEENFNCKLSFQKAFEPSYLDVLLHKLNPNNNNETAFVYKVEYKQ